MRQILNGSCKVTSREGAEAEAEAEEEVYQGTHLVGIIASSSLPSCVGVCVRPPSPLHSKRSKRAKVFIVDVRVRGRRAGYSMFFSERGTTAPRPPRSTPARFRPADLYVANGPRARRRETHWE